jgi:NSS family neurotransmitter:Na+ symporter
VTGDIKIGKWFNHTVKFLIPAEAILLLVWWLYRSIEWNPQGWYNPFQADSLGTCIVQWMVALGLLFFLNGIIQQRLLKRNN